VEEFEARAMFAGVFKLFFPMVRHPSQDRFSLQGQRRFTANDTPGETICTEEANVSPSARTHVFYFVRLRNEKMSVLLQNDTC
jgi:hypothetical protein